MYEYYDNNNVNFKQSRKDLKNIYLDIPETEGCMENISKSGGCGAICCQFQSPSLFYSEFMNVWINISNHWKKEQIVDIIAKAIEATISGITTKGCIFWDKDTKMCTTHNERPFNCRVYSQLPDEEFKPKYERLKILYQNDNTATLLEQCNLTKTVGNKPTTEDIELWFQRIKKVEEDLKVPKTEINDQQGGSYRQFHDHIILKWGNQKLINQIIKLKQKGSIEEKKNLVELFKTSYNQYLKVEI
jgi:Fe-S-cluster containining protein